MSKAVEHIFAAEAALQKSDMATGADVVNGNRDTWIKEAQAHALLAIACKMLPGTT